MHMKPLLNASKIWLTNNKTLVLTGASIVLSGAAVAFGIHATPKYTRKIETLDELKYPQRPTKGDKAKALVKYYWPVAVCYAGSATCAILAHSSDAKKITALTNTTSALTNAYALSEKALQTYKKQVKEELGEEKEHDISEKAKTVMADQREQLEIVVDPDDDVLCYDELTGVYFKSTPEKIRAAMNAVNASIRTDDSATLNDLYFEIGLPEVRIGDMLEWRIDNGYGDVAFKEHLSPSKKPAVCMSLKNLTWANG